MKSHGPVFSHVAKLNNQIRTWISNWLEYVQQMTEMGDNN